MNQLVKDDLKSLFLLCLSNMECTLPGMCISSIFLPVFFVLYEQTREIS